MTIPLAAARREEAAQRHDELKRLAEWFRAREAALVSSLVNDREVGLNIDGAEPDAATALVQAYWSSPTLQFPAPPCGLGRGEIHTPAQRIALVQFALFNWAMTESRNRYFPRRSTENNLHTPAGRPPPPPVDGYILPVLATAQQIYDLVPQSAIHNNQLATRCARPEEAMVAAVANRARREAEAEAIAAALGGGAVSPETKPMAFTASAPIAIAPRQQLTPVHDTFDDFDYTSAPLKFNEPGVAVPVGSASFAQRPAPGAERTVAPPHKVNVYPFAQRAPLPSALVDELELGLAAEDIFAPSSPTYAGGSAPASAPVSASTSISSSFSALGLYGTSMNSAYSLTTNGSASASSYGGGMTAATVRETADWVCLCGTHNYAARTQCIKVECRMFRGTGTPLAPRSALGDPGDWFCDFCGLCNWARRGFCLRCCPLDADNLEEAITKGVVHFADPIIDILGLGDRRARALKKKVSPTSHCACFGPHHGTRCPHVGVGVNAELWDAYAGAQAGLGGAPSVGTRSEVPMMRTVATPGRRRV